MREAQTFKTGIYELLFPNGKVYIGQSQVDVEKEMRETLKTPGQRRALANAINKYGADSVVATVISRCPPEECNDAERAFIDMRGSLVPHGYNLLTGGKNGGRPSEEALKRMRESKKGMYRGKNNPFYGKKHSKEARARISMARKGKTLSAETRAKISAKGKGRKVSEETRARIGRARKGRKHSAETKAKMSGKNNHFYGKKHSEATRKKMRDKRKGKKPNLGKKHSAETREKIGAANKGKNNPFYGKKHSEEARKKMSEGQKRRRQREAEARQRSKSKEQ